MELFQRQPNGKIILETGYFYPVYLVIDTSLSMGQYNPRNIEKAVNLFFKKINRYGEIVNLLNIAVYESNKNLKFLGDFHNGKNFKIDRLLSGGKWNLIESIADVCDIAIESVLINLRSCVSCISPLIVIVSDNQLSTIESDYEILHDFQKTIKDKKLNSIEFCFISTKQNNFLSHFISDIDFRCVEPNQIQDCMLNLADDVVDKVKRNNQFLQKKGYM